MKRGIKITFMLAAVLFVTSSLVRAEIITWDYEDDFSTEKIRYDSYHHSRASSLDGEIPPLPLPFLLYTNDNFDPAWALLFARWEDEYGIQDAFLAYNFPLDNILDEVDSGTFEVDVIYSTLPMASPYISCQLSEGGIEWTEPVALVEGHNQISLLSSTDPFTYIKLTGRSVFIDNLSVTVSGPEIPEPATICLVAAGLAGIILSEKEI
jgi:hypothetical protein